MVIQYGFITLFVVAFPLTPLFALVNNILEVHVDSFKVSDTIVLDIPWLTRGHKQICIGHRRPFPHRAVNIGSW